MSDWVLNKPLGFPTDVRCIFILYKKKTKDKTNFFTALGLTSYQRFAENPFQD